MSRTVLGTSSTANSGRTVEQIYQKKSQLEHILLRPDTYGAGPDPGARVQVLLTRRRPPAVGSIERISQLMWVFDKEQGKLVYKSVSFVRTGTNGTPFPAAHPLTGPLRAHSRSPDCTKSLTKFS